MKQNRALIAVFTLVSVFPTLGAEDSWKRMEEGKARFAERQFETALVAFKDAAAIRRARYEKAMERLESVLSSPEAARNGDSLRLLLDRLAERDLRKGDLAAVRAEAAGSLQRELRLIEGYRISDVHQNLIDVLSDLLLIMSAEGLGDSLSGLRTIVERSADYPEAEFWIGKVFLVEGERAIAERQFKKSIDEASALIVGDEVQVFRYELARLYLLTDPVTGKRDYVSMERILKEILAGDPLYSGADKARLRDAMKKSVTERGIDKFLELYRHEAEFARKAYSTLGEYYCKSGRYSQATLHLMLAADISATRMVKVLLERDPDYRFKTLAELLAAARSDQGLAEYAAEEEFERTLYFLGASLLGEGRPSQAKGVWRSMNGGSGEWAERAERRLEDMKKEPVTERPEL